jgi:hypothetical protein
MKYSRISALACAAAIGAIALAGCGSSSTAPTTEGPAFAEFAQETIDEALAAGASEEQLSMLEVAKETGSVPLDDARTAARNAVQCMEDAGVVAEYTEETTSAGLVLPNYRAQIPDDQPVAEQLIVACDEQEFLWVGKLYALQPSSTAVMDEHVEERLPMLRACLDQSGVAVDAEATRAELFEAAAKLLEDSGWETDCFKEAGIDGY